MLISKMNLSDMQIMLYKKVYFNPNDSFGA